MYNPDYKVGLLRTLESERNRNKVLKRKLAALNTEVQDLYTDGEGWCSCKLGSWFSPHAVVDLVLKSAVVDLDQQLTTFLCVHQCSRIRE